ncbi:hypothetical protein P4O66_002712 [Electrophorus voltai]|uniref:Endonuclease/exonuclease/phosphatase domain-containing protein n=1 Tax=Electrophorus voltai TaxID=2609070 RepID=A0AAD8YTV7_9TELE|nr:hypothetical protein P4O66_002712 [Electrophorus voltai]
MNLMADGVVQIVILQNSLTNIRFQEIGGNIQDIRAGGQTRRLNLSNLTDSQRFTPSHILVAGELWNCQSAVQKADFISALASLHFLHFLALTETWITPENSATPDALSSAFSFTHSPRRLSRGGGTVLMSREWCFTPLSFSTLSISSFEFHAMTVSCPTKLLIIVICRPPGFLDHFTDELDILLSQFPMEGNPLIILGDFNLPSDKLHSSCILLLLMSFDLTLNHSLNLIFTHTTTTSDTAVTPLHLSAWCDWLCLEMVSVLSGGTVLSGVNQMTASSLALCIATYRLGGPNPAAWTRNGTAPSRIRQGLAQSHRLIGRHGEVPECLLEVATANMSSQSSTTTSSLNSLVSSTEPISSPSDNQSCLFLLGAAVRLHPLTPEKPRKLWKMDFMYEEQELRWTEQDLHTLRIGKLTLDCYGTYDFGFALLIILAYRSLWQNVNLMERERLKENDRNEGVKERLKERE